MKKQQLRECFDRIRPSEALIEATLSRMNEKRNEARMPARRGVSLPMMTRLAGAACALLLVLGVGVVLLRGEQPGAVVPRESEDGVTMTADDQGTGTDGASEPDVEVLTHDQMIEVAKGYGTLWAVVRAEAVMIGGNGEVGLHLISSVAISDAAAAQGLTAGGGEALDAVLVNVDEQWQSMSDAMGSVLLVGLHAEEREGETVWLIHEFAVEDSVAQ